RPASASPSAPASSAPPRPSRAAPRTTAIPPPSRCRHLHEALRRVQVLPHLVVRVAAPPDRWLAARRERVLERRADGVDGGAASLAHALRPKRRERRRRLEIAVL